MCWKQQDLSKKVYIPVVEIAEEIIEPRVLETEVCLFADIFTYVSNCQYFNIKMHQLFTSIISASSTPFSPWYTAVAERFVLPTFVTRDTICSAVKLNVLLGGDGEACLRMEA